MKKTLWATAIILNFQLSIFNFLSAQESPLYCAPVNDLKGFINAKGEMVVEPQYIMAHDFSEGLASVFTEEESKWGFIDATGKMVIAPQFNWAEHFS